MHVICVTTGDERVTNELYSTTSAKKELNLALFFTLQIWPPNKEEKTSFLTFDRKAFYHMPFSGEFTQYSTYTAFSKYLG